eukprot:TRINITY_DN1158_c0_g1_i4.p1 TRINITY_DN1158_c0_g1~~TRINITY_DN1158_c0_g1_i4.p1  ORF type:complete len:635 (+),score=117.40 TRINITY_DN1158_c0_g1_i4:64-1968(+)
MSNEEQAPSPSQHQSQVSAGAPPSEQYDSTVRHVSDPLKCQVTGMRFLTSKEHPAWERYLANNSGGNSGIYYIHHCDKVSSKDARQPRLIIVSFRKLIMVDAEGSIKQYSSMAHVQQLVRKRAVSKGKSVDQVLVKIPTETDMLLEFVANKKNDTTPSPADKFCETIKTVREAQESGSGASMMSVTATTRRQKWNGIEEARPVANLFMKARLQKVQAKGYQTPEERLHSYVSSKRGTSPKPSPLGPDDPRRTLGPIPASPTSGRGETAPTSFPLADAARKNISATTEPLESPRVGKVHQDGKYEVYNEELHEVEFLKGLPQGFKPTDMTCVRCGTKNLHESEDGYVSCKCDPGVYCCKPCFASFDVAVEHEDAQNTPESPRRPATIDEVPARESPAAEHAHVDEPPPPRSSSPAPGTLPSPEPTPHASTATNNGRLPKSPPRSPQGSDTNSIRRGGRVPAAVSEISPAVIREAPATSSPVWDDNDAVPKYGSALFPAWDQSSGTEPPIPPRTWCYYEQVNPDPSARKHTYYVYKKRQISLESDADGTWFVMASKRQLKDNTPEKIHLSCILKVGEESPQSCTLNSLKIGFFVRTTSTKYVFLTPTTIERTIWLQWFENMYPDTRVEDSIRYGRC